MDYEQLEAESASRFASLYNRWEEQVRQGTHWSIPLESEHEWLRERNNIIRSKPSIMVGCPSKTEVAG